MVVKVGGSLLDWPPLPGRLADFLEGLGGVRPLLIVGGGRMADSLRDLDTIHGLGERRSHELALRILDVTAHLLVDIMPGTTIVDRLDGLDRAWSAGVVPVLAPRKALAADDRLAPTEALPHTWAVTTDSIAARVATLLKAERLILLKSAPPPQDMALAVSMGLVDPHFSMASQRLSNITYVAFHQEIPTWASLHRESVPPRGR